MRVRPVCGWLALLGPAGGCSDYGLKGEDPHPQGDSSPPIEDTQAPQDSDPPEDTDDSGVVPPPDCSEVEWVPWPWQASSPFAAADDPQDSAGRYWYEVDFEEAGYAGVGLPDRGIPAGQDRIYRARFRLEEGQVPPNLSLVLQSDDGLRVYVNGAAVGQWGGGWQEEGCVNEEAGCSVTEVVAPVDVTALVGVGDNVVAARVSNPLVNSWFSITPTCLDGEKK